MDNYGLIQIHKAIQHALDCITKSEEAEAFQELVSRIETHSAFRLLLTKTTSSGLLALSEELQTSAMELIQFSHFAKGIGNAQMARLSGIRFSVCSGMIDMFLKFESRSIGKN